MSVQPESMYTADLSVSELGKLHARQMADHRSRVIAAKLAARQSAQEEADQTRRERQLAEQALRLDMSTRSVPMPDDVQRVIDTVVLAADIDAAAEAIGVHPATLLEWMDQAGNRAHVETIHRRRARAAAFDGRSVAADDSREPAARAVELKALAWEAERFDRSSYGDRAIEPTDPAAVQLQTLGADAARLMIAAIAASLGMHMQSSAVVSVVPAPAKLSAPDDA